LLQAELLKPLHRLPLHLGGHFVSWPLVRKITRRSDQRQYCGLAQGFAGLEAVQPVEENVSVLIFTGADQYCGLLAHLKNALSDAFNRLGVESLSPFHRDVNSVD
jgi:hypothetical protein